ncbi:MAG: hypothetical protein LBB78_05560 [Spirochaetaceae bacterium]|jgi:hypothetical protein|nr:hypothetical protein [Spirochaetaceae bacterium]
MTKKSLFFGAAALALLVLLAFVGCSNPSSGTTEYVAQASSEYPFPPDTVFVNTRAALDGLLNEYTAETNQVRHIAFTTGDPTAGPVPLTIPTGKYVYLTDNLSTGIAANITVTEGATLVLVGEFAAGNTGLLLVKGTIEVFRELAVTDDARDVADYTVESIINPGRNTVIGKKVTILPGATLHLVYEDIIPPDQYSENKFTPAQAWAAAGQGNLEVAPANTGLFPDPYLYTVKELLTGVYPSAARSYTFTSPRTTRETLPALIPQGADITTSATPEDSDGNTLTVNGSLITNGTLKNITEIKVGNGGELNLTRATGDVLDKLAKLTVGPGALFEVDTPLVTLQSLETLFLGDGSQFIVDAGVPATPIVTFTQDPDKKLVTTLGKKVLYRVGTAPDAIVDVVINGDASLINGSRLTVNPDSTFTLAEDKTLTVETGAIVDFSAVQPPAAVTDPSPVIIKGTIEIEEGGTLIGPALVDFEATPEVLFDTIKFVTAGKVVLDWGAAYTMGTGLNAKPYIGPHVAVYSLATSPTYQWANVATPGDGAQIEINAAGLIIRDTNAGTAAVRIDNTRAVILKGQSLTLEDAGVTLTIVQGNTLWLVGDPETAGVSSNGAKLLGPGTVKAGSTSIVGGPNGWQAVGQAAGDSIGIYADDPAARLVSSTAAATGTPAAILKALHPLQGSFLGATITQAAVASNNLTISANTTIALGGAAQKKAGEIVLTGGTNPGKITFTNDTSKITTGNSSASTTSTGPLAAGGVTAVTGGTITTIGVTNLVGDGTNTKITTTATPSTPNNNLMGVGNLASLLGATGGTITGGAASNNGVISSETITNADITP